MVKIGPRTANTPFNPQSFQPFLSLTWSLLNFIPFIHRKYTTNVSLILSIQLSLNIGFTRDSSLSLLELLIFRTSDKKSRGQGQVEGNWFILFCLNWLFYLY